MVRIRLNVASSLILVPALVRDSEGFCLFSLYIGILQEYLPAGRQVGKKILSDTTSHLISGRVF